MIVKEIESHEYNCPQMIVTGKDSVFCSCKGASCMAWRWATEDNPDYLPPHVNFVTDPRKNPPFIRSKTHGYCGMAGGA